VKATPAVVHLSEAQLSELQNGVRPSGPKVVHRVCGEYIEWTAPSTGRRPALPTPIVPPTLSTASTPPMAGRVHFEDDAEWALEERWAASLVSSVHRESLWQGDMEVVYCWMVAQADHSQGGTWSDWDRRCTAGWLEGGWEKLAEEKPEADSVRWSSSMRALECIIDDIMERCR
jgi:hypothetical protein